MWDFSWNPFPPECRRKMLTVYHRHNYYNNITNNDNLSGLERSEYYFSHHIPSESGALSRMGLVSVSARPGRILIEVTIVPAMHRLRGGRSREIYTGRRTDTVHQGAPHNTVLICLFHTIDPRYLFMCLIVGSGKIDLTQPQPTPGHGVIGFQPGPSSGGPATERLLGKW